MLIRRLVDQYQYQQTTSTSTSRLVKKTDFKTKTAEIKTKYLILQADKIPNITG